MAPPGPTVEKVKVALVVQNISFTALQSSPSLVAEFEQACKQSIAEADADLKPEDVEVKLEAGSVVVKAEISTPPGQNASSLDGKIQNGIQSISTRLVARVEALPGIASVKMGAVTATTLKVTVFDALCRQPQLPRRHHPSGVCLSLQNAQQLLPMFPRAMSEWH
jgi:hypothetical protein